MFPHMKHERRTDHRIRKLWWKKMMEISRRVFVVMLHFIGLSVARHHNRSGEDALEHTGGRALPGLCSYDVNECGFLERPCSQRCMNTHGSYRCYCDPGYTLSADGYTCTSERGRLFLPALPVWLPDGGRGSGALPVSPGLHLATDNKTCEDVDECRRDAHVCRARQTCKNTFGSFVCVCQDGFVMGTLQGSVQCRDKDECLTGSHQCIHLAQCVNTDGSYTCQCSEGYSGNGRTCWPRRAPQTKAAMYFNYKLSKRTKPKPPSS
ncbi:hypothetical protein F7725_005860 [Dissostichus mawsoni]|uniref:EGF-like domain-containing protein n=1 Tax=Dissostichus mawsoni TaxID=36200 RepID=A0A7J5YSR1_DISMA|nr:hypothetical protein F7725_005860 [Dissostichus mawsoni]